MRQLLRLLAVALALVVPTVTVLATCGGGGGGGVGGVAPDAGGEAKVYRVAWQVIAPGAALPKSPEAALVVYWFPLGPDQARASDLQTSRALALSGSRCVAAAIVTTDHKLLHDNFQAPAGEEAVVLATPDGTELGRVTPNGKKLDVRTVERMLNLELDKRETELETLVKGADKKAATDRGAAIDDYKQVWQQRCLFPGLGKKAARGLKKLGVAVEQAALDELGPESLPDADIAGRRSRVERALEAGLEAELTARYGDAEALYRKATQLDPADPTALRFLGELYRHQTGEWDQAKAVFERLLAQPADPIARAVALHGLGKMTIHSGRFGDGLAMFHRSLESYPLAITYRNLAVYWFSEKQADKAAGYMRQALGLEPEDRYNQIFAAVYLAAAGQHQEAAEIARANEEVMEASYNLAAIWAQVGDRKKAMELLRRHFYGYEQFDAVRAMEMQEARDDYMFAGLHADPEFQELTQLATRHRM